MLNFSPMETKPVKPSFICKKDSFEIIEYSTIFKEFRCFRVEGYLETETSLNIKNLSILLNLGSDIRLKIRDSKGERELNVDGKKSFLLNENSEIVFMPGKYNIYISSSNY